MRRDVGRSVRKRCARCGEIAWHRPRDRKCWRPRFGKGSYACHGDLVLVAVRKEKSVLDVVQSNVAVVESRRKTKPRPQDAAQRKLDAVRRKIAEKVQALARLSKSLHALEARARRLAKAASLTDLEIEQQRQARERARERRAAAGAVRSISIDGKI